VAQINGVCMLIIKRYSNRKLYDTQEKKYISLSNIRQMIHSGHEIQVINNETGEDITSQILADLIAGAEKTKHGFLPQEFLSDMIRLGQDRIAGLQQAIGLSTMFSRLVDHEISRRLSFLVESGILSGADRENINDMLMMKAITSSMTPNVIDEYFPLLLQEANIPSRNDFDLLEEQLEQISLQLNALMPAASNNEDQ
jgi:polyhydroxyalkanoate synthesis repressor PhaR